MIPGFTDNKHIQHHKLYYQPATIPTNWCQEHKFQNLFPQTGINSTYSSNYSLKLLFIERIPATIPIILCLEHTLCQLFQQTSVTSTYSSNYSHKLNFNAHTPSNWNKLVVRAHFPATIHTNRFLTAPILTNHHAMTSRPSFLLLCLYSVDDIPLCHYLLSLSFHSVVCSVSSCFSLQFVVN